MRFRSLQETDFFDELLAETHTFLTMSMSLSLSMSVPETTTAPNNVATPAPSMAQSQPNNQDSDRPSTSPTTRASDFQSDVPSQSPSSPPTFTFDPSEGVFECTEEGTVQISQPPFDSVTVIPFRVEYIVESTVPLVDYSDSVESRILATVLAGALQCTPGTPAYNATSLLSNTNTVPSEATCTPEISNCTVLTSEFQLAINSDADADVVAFLGYLAIRDDMDAGVFASSIENVDRAVYLAPLPLLPPSIEDGDQQPEPVPVLESGGSGSVSPLALSAVLAMSIGGTVALLAWVRNRRTRNERHLTLMEDHEMSIGSPSSDTH